MPALLHSLSARLALTLAMLFVLMGIFFVFLMGAMTERYQQEVAQKLNHIGAEGFITSPIPPNS